MSILRSPESSYVQERAKWESVPTVDCPLALRPYEFRPYPAMFYKAERPPQGGPAVFESHVVESDVEASNMRSRGWGQGQAEAITMLEQRESDVAHAAATRAFHELRMSEKARKEADAYDESTAAHVPEIPETPIRKRRTKAEMDAAK
jgi:hypothetical protein